MTNNRTTELLCKLLDERGIEWSHGDASYEIEWSTPDGRHCSAMYWKPTFTALISGCTPEQAIAATLGEQIVRCRDCKYYHDGTTNGRRYAEPHCLAIGELAYGALFEVDEDCFCSWGERKEVD